MPGVTKNMKIVSAGAARIFDTVKKEPRQWASMDTGTRKISGRIGSEKKLVDMTHPTVRHPIAYKRKVAVQTDVSICRSRRGTHVKHALHKTMQQQNCAKQLSDFCINNT